VRLASIRDPGRFVWAILPHAARTFSACIVMLPDRLAVPAAVAYLYCRILDTYEDLLPDPARREALAAAADRLESIAVGERPPPAPRVGRDRASDGRDAAHVLLVERTGLVDQVALDLPGTVRGLVRDLVREMATGMAWSSERFAEQGGALRDAGQLDRYCWNVLGAPIGFCTRLFRWDRSGDAHLPPGLRDEAAAVGSFLQLANVTRDLEKDLRRGVAYDPALAADLGGDAQADPGLATRIRRVRSCLLDRALDRAPAYLRLVESLEFPRLSLARASCVLMLLFTERYYLGCARSVGRGVPGPPRGRAWPLLRALPALLSGRAARRDLARSLARLGAARVAPAATMASQPGDQPWPYA
jgi:phytoene/squalene synthetase